MGEQPADDRAGMEDQGDLVAIPAFQSGGLVEHTGIALVHQGEFILPAPGSEAVISAVEGPRVDRVINYFFPVDIQVIGLPSREHLRTCADFVFDELLTALGAR